MTAAAAAMDDVINDFCFRVMPLAATTVVVFVVVVVVVPFDFLLFLASNLNRNLVSGLIKNVAQAMPQL